MKKEILEAYNKTKAYYCLDCGKCTSNCPVSRYNEGFSPRLLVKEATAGFDEDVIDSPELWDCLTCNKCADGCRSDVQFAEFIREVRREAVKTGNTGVCTHGGILQGLIRFMTTPELTPDKLYWLTDDLKTSKKGKVLLFTGCLPIFQTTFNEINPHSLDILRASIKLMNKAGIEPVLSNEERCCGHDMLWTGDIRTFQRLAELNAKIFHDLGIETIVTVCPEGFMTLKKDYPVQFNNGTVGAGGQSWDFKVVHITEYLVELVNDGTLAIPDENPFNGSTVTYHDPCRLGRFMGVYDAPRVLLGAVPGLQLTEMEHHRNHALCCGVSGWMNCTNISRSIRAERLTEAKATGADRLITSCPKCQIHFKCYTTNEFVEPRIKLDIDDITVFLAKAAGLME
ncbi:(Fe-S)-binding protein [[Eubacterium] cellulosolvens]